MRAETACRDDALQFEVHLRRARQHPAELELLPRDRELQEDAHSHQ